MRIGICAGVEHAAALASAGCGFVELNVQGFLTPLDTDDGPWRARLDQARSAALPLAAANCFLPGALKCVGPDVDRAALRAYAATAFRRAAEAGIGTIVFGSGGSRRVPDGWARDAARAQFVDLLAELAPMAAAHAVTLVLEPLNSAECNLVTSVPDGAAIVREVDHPRLRLLADLYHMMRDGQGAGELEPHVALLAHVHVAERERRTPPGTDGDDFRPYLAALARGGYRGAVSMECRFDDVAAQAAPAVAALRHQLADAGFGGAATGRA